MRPTALRRRFAVAAWLVLVAVALLLPLPPITPASAAEITDRPLLKDFDGSGTRAGAFSRPVALAIDQTAGVVYVVDGEKGVIDKFNLEGEAQSFSSCGSCGSSLAPGFKLEAASLAVDNSGGLGAGRIYVARTGEVVPNVAAFDAAGTQLPWTLAGFYAVGVTVDSEGHLWVGNNYNYPPRFEAPPQQLQEYESSGSPPAEVPLASFPLPYQTTAGGLFADAAEGLYLSGGYGLDEYPLAGHGDLAEGSATIASYEGAPFAVGQLIFGHGIAAGTVVSATEEVAAGKFKLTLSAPATASGTAVALRSRKRIDETQSFGVAGDQSEAAGHVFALHREAFEEYDAAGTLLGEFAKARFAGAAIAYDKAADRVYVIDAKMNRVEIFGAPITATVPDVKIGEASEIGRNKATLNGEVNPQGVPNAYVFQWKEGTSGSWEQAEESAPQGLPEDSVWHPVSLPITGLRSNTTYQFRLIATNTEKGLRAISGAAEFTTPKPPVPLIEEPCGPSSISTESAHFACTIDTQEDRTTWRLLRAARPGASRADCEALTSSEFTPAKEGTISLKEAEEQKTVAIAVDLSNLKPAQTSCLRLIAANGGGSASWDGVFQTRAVAPTEAETAFAAPRTDTTVRLNAWVNPEGEKPLSYGFEVSADGGEHWEALEPRESSLPAWGRILVGEELTGLEPATTYLYRLASAANHCNPAAPEELCSATGLPTAPHSFTTRTTEEVKLPHPRGYELVNSPDKGDQNVLPNQTGTPYPPSESTPDGEEALWSVTSGAPGARTATDNLFLARRSGQSEATPSGWSSAAVVPPPAEQLGKGRFAYELLAATPGLSRFVFDTGESNITFRGETAIVRTGRGAGEEVLERISPTGHAHEGALPEVSEDGSHVITVDPESGRLEDIGRPGSPEVLSIMPDGADAACPLVPGSSWPGAGTNDGVGVSHRSGYSLIAPADASRVYFQVQRGGECGEEGEPAGPFGLYVRNRETNKTTLIDPGSSGLSPELVRASADGRNAYYLTASKCRRWKYEGPSAPPACKEEEAEDKNTGVDLYRWEEGKGRSVCLSCQVKDEAGDKIEDVAITPRRPVILSDDFSRLYFESEAQLVPGRGRAGAPNLYLLSGGVVRFVAAPEPLIPALGALFRTEAEASAGGDVLVFSSRTGGTAPPLTADAVAADCPSLEEGEKGMNTVGCFELYLYDARAQSLECLSCRRGGLTTQSWRGLKGPVGYGYIQAGFALSADGSTVAFPTPEALLPEDVNNGMDIYEWRNGAIRLLTDGITQFPEGFSSPVVGGIDASGANVFFAVVDPGLTGFEHDGVLNLYDARIGGGLPRPAPPTSCAEDSCQGSLQAPPPPGAEGSATYRGPGNPREATKPHCRRGEVRRHGICVKRRHHRHRKDRHHRQGGRRK